MICRANIIVGIVIDGQYCLTGECPHIKNPSQPQCSLFDVELHKCEETNYMLRCKRCIHAERDYIQLLDRIALVEHNWIDMKGQEGQHGHSDIV